MMQAMKEERIYNNVEVRDWKYEETKRGCVGLLWCKKLKRGVK